MAKQKETDHTAINLVGSGTTIKGEIESKGDIRVDGKIIGEVRSKGKIVVGETGVVEGDLYCANAEFSGKLEGKADVSELLSLKASAVFRGDIITNKLSIEPGAKFSGTCSMDQDNIAATQESGKEKKSRLLVRIFLQPLI